MRIPVTRKIHLYTLPEVLPEPLPKYDDSNTEAVIVFPLFSDGSGAFPEVFLRAMLWNKRAYLRNSDAIDTCLPIKFYIEDYVYQQTKDYLHSQGVTEKDVLVFNADAYGPDEKHSTAANLALKCLPFIDQRLRCYDRIFVSDIDMFLCRTSLAKAHRFPILKRIKSVPTHQIGACRIDYFQRHADADVPSNWLRRFKGMNTKVWYETIDAITPLSQTSVFPCDNGSFYVFASKFHQHYTNFVAYAEKAIQQLRDDEAVMSLFRYQHPEIGHSLSYMGLPYLRRDAAILEAEQTMGFYYMHVIDNYINTWLRHI